ncbi:tetratricopeptide repeat protein [Sphingobacterium sp. LRF_L2]|uniref:tetratricopeptide repeat protein n=1 Tax=Sphingobacterium sp. LRF_L2 TaxID=3369421 RepID=UPI003F5F17CD
MEPSNAENYRNRGRVWFYMEKYDSAIKEYTKAIELNPNDSVALEYRSTAYEKNGNRALAEADRTRAKQISD